MRGKAAAAAAALLVAGCSSAGSPVAATGLGPGRPWRVGYTGYGTIQAGPDSGVSRITLHPARATTPAQTHAALVLSRRSYGDVTATIRLLTSRQLRTPHANPWEVGWILWHYTSGRHFYYIALKPNGWELGKADPRYPGDQRFLETAPQPRFPPRRWYTVSLTQRGNHIDVTVDGHHLVSFTDHQDPYLSGEIGLYTEDASVTFEPVSIGPAARRATPAAAERRGTT